MFTLWQTLLGKAFLRSLFDVRVTQDGPLPQRNLIVAANHHGWIDPVLITFAWPARADFMYIGPWQAITNTPLKRWFVQSQPRVVPTVRRTGWPGKTAYQTVLDGLKNGKSLLIFPEGDSYPDEGSLMPFLNGVGHFALRTGVPIVPAGLCGTAELYYRKCLWMHLGRPIFVPLVPRPSGSQVAEVVEEVRECVRRLVEGYRDPIVAHKPMHWLTHLL